MVISEWLIMAASLAIAVIIIFIAYRLLKLTVKYMATLILNALGGMFIIPMLLISAVCGIPGAVCIIILKLMGIML
ncbi:hypothetical protein [Methanocella conradii]|uniref:hypothetical protein n=1 Tax=Methanocella conradii TaxID=1175444 RepID=UPI00157CA056|nr:hypothetical protein [Methanocella conradii]